jgi:hypothetical protein
MKRIVRTIIALAAAATLSACAGYAPPQAWEKGYLAKPAMQFDADRLDAKNLQHILYSKEGSAGGYGVGGGGCGCN